MFRNVLITALLAAGLFVIGLQVIEHYPVSKVYMDRPIAGDRLFVPEGYEQQLRNNHLTKIAALPYFSSPFICIAKDVQGQQLAVVFKSTDEFTTVKLPLTYEEIVQRLKALGHDIKNIGNLHMFEVNNRLVWSFSEAEYQVYLELDGTIVVNPF